MPINEGSIGDNYTGVCVDGFEISDTNYLVAGNVVVDSSKYNDSNAARNVYVAALNKSTNAVKKTLITNYSTSDIGAGNPQFVKINDNKFILLWSVKNDTSKVYYTEINGSGDQVGSVYEMDASLSDCAPIIINNKATWYVWKNNKIFFYQIDANNISSYSVNTVIYDFPLVNESYVVTPTIKKGESAIIKIAASGGDGEYTLNYYIRKKSTGTLVYSGSKSYSSNFGMQINTACEYEVQVDASDSEGKFESKTMSFKCIDDTSPIANISVIDKKIIMLGESAKIIGEATGGTNDYHYSYYYRLQGNTDWIPIGAENTSSTTVSFTPEVGGIYDLMVRAEDSNNDIAEKTFTLTAAVDLVNESYIENTSVYVHNNVKLHGVASGGTYNYRYAYYYKPKSNTEWKTIGYEYITSKTSTLSLSTAGQYDFLIRVRDTNNTIVDKQFEVTVCDKMSNNSTISKTEMYNGESLTMNAEVTGGIGNKNYTYYYRLKDASSWTVIGTENTASESAKFTPQTAGNYELMIKAIDSNNSTSEKTFNVTVVETLTNESTIDKDVGYLGDNLSIHGAASGGFGSYSYSYYWFDRQKPKFKKPFVIMHNE